VNVTRGAARLEASISNSLPRLNVEVQVPAATTLAVMGRNGAGKSTFLRVLAGLVRTDMPSAITLGGDTLVDDSTFVPPHRRKIALLAQEPGLFPHLSVAENVAFGPAAQHLGRRDVTERVHRWLAATNTTELAERKPGALSGGQAQRVAIARALATEPTLLLLDEPLRALDVDVAGTIRALLRTVVAEQKLTTVFVSHDIADAVALGDQMIVLDDGNVAEQGAVRDVLRAPRSAFASQLAGLSLIAGHWRAGRFCGDVELVGECLEPLSDGDTCLAAMSPEDVSVFTERPPSGSPRNILAATVRAIEPVGDRARLSCEVNDCRLAANVTWASVAELALSPGTQVFLSVKRSAVRVYSAR
jgi:molybdate transport system ATP-binding protein